MVATGLETFATPPADAATQAAKPRIPGSQTSGSGVRSMAYFGLFQAISAAGISAPEPLEHLLGRRTAVNHSFRQPPEAPWAPLRARMLADKHAGRIPMLSYAAGEKDGIKDHQAAANARLADIAAGRRDRFIDGQATALAALRTPVFLRFTWEFDRRYPGANGARTHRVAWRHVHQRFQAKGATNVAFVWCPSWLAFNDGTAATYYPGDQYVDWVGADGYSRAPNWPSFETMFTKPSQFAARHHKPFMVCETGVNRLNLQSGQTYGSTAQSRWVDGLRTSLSENALPNLKALLYFHVDGDNDPLPNQWRLTLPTNGPALRSFKSLAWHPRMQA